MATPAWQIRSNSTKSLVLSAGVLAVGILFIWLTRHGAAGDTDIAAARWLGVLLAAVGLAGLVFAEEIVVTVEAQRRALKIEKRRWVGNWRVSVPFEEIAAVNVAKVGTRSDGTPSFWLQLERRDGTVVGTGRWSTRETEINRLAERLSAEIGCGCGTGHSPAPASVGRVAAAVVGAALVYVAWYRVTVGPWCGAMWHGTAPAVIMLASFAACLALLRRWGG